MQNSSEWILMTSVHGGHVEGVNNNTKINYLHENKTFFQWGIVLLFCSSNKAEHCIHKLSDSCKTGVCV